MGHVLELDHDPGLLAGQPLAGGQVKRHPLPAPVVDKNPHHCKSRGNGFWIYSLLFPVACHLPGIDPAPLVLAKHQVIHKGFTDQGFDGPADLGLFVPHPVILEK